MTDGAAAQSEKPSSTSRHSLDSSLIRGIGWTGGMRWFAQVVSWGATLVVARLLTPAEYGLVGMAVVYGGFVELVSDFGLGAALVQRRGLEADRIARVGGLAVLMGVLLFLVSVAVARPIAAFYGEPAVAGIIIVLAVNYVLAGIQLVPQSLLIRELRFRQLAWLRGAEALSLTAWTVTLAVLQAGYWALVIGLVASKLTATILVLIWKRHPVASPFPLGPIASEIRFGWQYMVSNIAWYLYTTADIAIVGRVLGKGILGAYSIAWNLASVPVERIAAPLGDVFRGIFSAVQNDRPALARYLCVLSEGLAVVTFPLAVGLALVADDCIPVLLGDQWLAAIAPLRLIALYAMVRSVSTLYAPILVATGHNRLNMRFNIIAAVLMPPLFLLGTRWGMVGVAAAGLAGYTAFVVTLSLRRVLQIVQLSFGSYLRSLAPAVIATGIMSLAVVLVGMAGLADPGSLTRLLLEVAVGALSYVTTLWLIHGTRLRALFHLLQEARGVSPAPPAVRASLLAPDGRIQAPAARFVARAARRLLIVTYHFPPDGAVGGLRWAALVKYLQPLGWEVHVLTAAAGWQGEPSLITSSGRSGTVVDLYRRFVLPRNTEIEALLEGENPRQNSRLRAELVAALSLPDESRGWALRAARKARRLVKSFAPDVVVSSGPPHSAHLVACLATAGRRARWLVDLRDPWPQMLTQVERWDPVHATYLARLFMPLLERGVMERSDGMLANTRPLATRLAARYPRLPVVWVPNGFDPARRPGARGPASATFVISHIGTLYGNRTGESALEALRKYVDRRALRPGDIRLEVVGHAEHRHRARFDRAVSRLNLEQYVVLAGPLPGPEAIDRLYHSQLSLVLARGQKLQVPAKLYESIGMGVPTLALAEADSATAQEARRLGAFVADPDDLERIAGIFELAHRQGPKTCKVPSEILYPQIAEEVSRLLSDPDYFTLQARAGADVDPGISVDGAVAAAELLSD
jgi:O-antigen/teichoic acid export membrane protein/glycosyltransferase involved in cell wall biosynthesis